MSYAEVGDRAKKLARATLERCGVGLAIPPIVKSDSRGDWVHVELGPLDVDLYRAAADRISAGRMDVFDLRDVGLAVTPQWNRDPKTGTMAPLRYGKALDCRDKRCVGDIRYLWEPNRHLALVTLAQTWILTTDDRYANSLVRYLESWLDQCPYLKGPNWSSSLELAIRVINWSISWQMMGGHDAKIFDGTKGACFRRRWLDSIFRHVHFVCHNYSSHSSANNHLIGEAAGVFIAASTWPLWEEFDVWGEQARRILETEVLRQNASDGVNLEQSTAYQHFVLDFLVLSLLVGQAARIEFSSRYRRRLEAMMEFIAAIMDVSGHVPMIGDADDGNVVVFSQESEYCPFRSLLATGAVLFDRLDFAAKALRFDNKSQWIFGKKGAQRFEELLAGSAGRESRTNGADKGADKKAFEEGGYYILGYDLETPDEIRCLVDCGPLGYLSLAAHAHADALAIWLSSAGREFLIDPGTYTYHAGRKWRDYFRGTAAHNTVRVDEKDQSIIGGDFLWLRKAAATCESFTTTADQVTFVGSHDGYKRLKDPVIHRREIRLEKERRSITVIDTIDCRRLHTVERFWHFAEDCRIQIKPSVVTAVNNGKTVRLGVDDGGPVRVYRGSVNPPCGWVSRRFGIKVPSFTVAWKQRIEGTTTLRTTIDCVP